MSKRELVRAVRTVSNVHLVYSPIAWPVADAAGVACIERAPGKAHDELMILPERAGDWSQLHFI